MRTTILAAALALLAAPASAQNIMGEYTAAISSQDRVNSNGQPLGNFCAMVQQDRANYHRFGKRDEIDSFDPVFSDRTLRGRIVNTCEFTGSAAWLAERAKGGYDVYIAVRILDDGGQMRVQISELAG